MWLDPFILLFKGGLQLPARRRVALGSGLTATDDPTNDQLLLSAPAQAGSLLPPRVVTVSGVDHTFNGDGSGGAVQVYPQTILFTHVDASVATFDFNVAGVEAGWTVFFSLEGVGGKVVVRNLGDELPIPIMVLRTDSSAGGMQGIYFDGQDWVALQAGLGARGAKYLPARLIGAGTYTIDSGATEDFLFLVDFSAGDITINLPPHSLGRLLVFKARTFGPLHTLTLVRNGGAGKVNYIAADCVLNYTGDVAWLCSDGIDNWCNLLHAGG